MVCGIDSRIGRRVPDRPLGLVDFGPSCQSHDDGYGEPTGRSRLDIDKQFLHSMLLACGWAARWYKPYFVLASLAHIYFAVARGRLGQTAWDLARAKELEPADLEVPPMLTAPDRNGSPYFF